MADAPEPKPPEQRAGAPAPEEPPEEPEVELSLADYFGGYAIIFFGVIGLALLFVLVTKLLR